jgi:hypothetical protein
MQVKVFGYATPRSSVAALPLRCSSLEDARCVLQECKNRGLHMSITTQLAGIGRDIRKNIPLIAGNIQDYEGLRYQYQMGGVPPSLPTVLILHMAWEAWLHICVEDASQCVSLVD